MSNEIDETESETMEIKEPLVMMFNTEDGMQCRLHLSPIDTYEHYALCAADLIRHIARCFNVEIDDVRAWVDKELDNPTTPITGNIVN